MHGGPTSVARGDQEESDRDSRSLAISVASLTLCPSNHLRDDRCCAATVLALIELHSREPETCYCSHPGTQETQSRRIHREVVTREKGLTHAQKPLMTYQTIQSALSDDVCVLTLNRPERLNALTAEVAIELQQSINSAVEEGARAIVLTGAGRAFCAGGDLREMQEIASREGDVGAFFDEPLRRLNDLILLIRKTRVPIIAAVNGAASGGGCNLALACDLVYAAESAKFNQAFIKIGLTPDIGGTFILPRLVGWKRAAELMFTGDMVSAQTAYEIGMINGVMPDVELIPHVMSLVRQLAQAPTAAIGRIKWLLEASSTNDYGSQLELERQAQIESGKTKDFVEGVTAFLEKRPAKFKGG